MPACPVIILFGPTGSGKTELLESLFCGARPLCRAEIISADSAQVYRGLDIGTAKPDAALREALPHHLLDIRNPDEAYNAGDFTRLANEAVREISGRGALPVISGGTGFYIANFLYGLPESPPCDPDIRRELKTELAARGAAALTEELAAKDGVSAKRIHPNDTYRLLRALEVLRLTGRPLSSYASRVTGERKARENVFVFGIERQREELYKRIDARCKIMFEKGLYDEVKTLAGKGYTPSAPGLRAIGYHEFFYKDDSGAYRIFENTRNSLDRIFELVARDTRRYAKRQLTYFKGIKEARTGGTDAVGRALASVLSSQNA